MKGVLSLTENFTVMINFRFIIWYETIISMDSKDSSD